MDCLQGFLQHQEEDSLVSAVSMRIQLHRGIRLYTSMSSSSPLLLDSIRAEPRRSLQDILDEALDAVTKPLDGDEFLNQ